MHGRFEEALQIHCRTANFETVSAHFLLVMINWHVTLNTAYCFPPVRLCQLLFLWVFSYWCKIKGLQLLLFELGCVGWRRYMFWMLDKHCIHVMDDQFSHVSLWWLTLFLVLAVVILVSLNLHSLIISVVELECCGEKKWQSLDRWRHNFLNKLLPGHKSELVS